MLWMHDAENITHGTYSEFEICSRRPIGAHLFICNDLTLELTLWSGLDHSRNTMLCDLQQN